MQKLTPFEISIQSDELAVRDGLAAILDALTPLDLGIEEVGTVEIVLAEVLNNIVEHAYPSRSQQGEIAVCCAHRENNLFVHIVDQGCAMPDGALPVGTRASVDVERDQLPEGGFGWFMIHHLTKDVTYKRINGENHLNLRLPLGLAS